MYEGGIRVPFIARWPGHIKPGQVSDSPCAFWDFLPTAAELAGAPIPSGMDGISFAPVLLGKPQKAAEYLYWEFHELGFHQAVRMGDWKGIRLGPNEPLSLYNLASDTGERDDVAPQNPEVVQRITKVLDTARTDSPDWPILTPEEAKKRAV